MKMDYKEIDRIFYRDGYRLADRYLAEGLNERNLSEAITQLFQVTDELLGSFLERTSAEGRPAACKKGCSWCCHQLVFAVTHEFLFLHQFIQRRTDAGAQSRFHEKARTKAAGTTGKSLQEQMQVRASCPFLHEGSCAVYEARPMACRIYLSASVETCRKEHEHPGDEKRFADLYEFPLRAGRMLNEGFVAYLKHSGLQTREYPVEQGYLSILDHQLTMAAWLMQRDDFA
jgi:Fe-S-cluster containining protein